MGNQGGTAEKPSSLMTEEFSYKEDTCQNKLKDTYHRI